MRARDPVFLDRLATLAADDLVGGRSRYISWGFSTDFLNSRIAPPSELPIWGSFPAPKMMSAIKKITNLEKGD